MKLVFSSFFVALASARSIINPVPYDLDARPADSKIVKPASWVEEIQADIGQDCAVNPFILDFLLTKADQNTPVQRSTVWKSLRKCKDNEAVKHIFTIDYLMKNKAELYGSLTSTTLEDGSIPILPKFQSNVDHDGDGTNDYIVEFLHLHGNKNFRENLKEWSKSKVYLNAMKWKMYNDLFNSMSLQKYQYWKRKAADLKLHKADAQAAYTNKLEQIRDQVPFLKPFMKKTTPIVQKPILPVAPAAPILPAQPIAPIVPQAPIVQILPAEAMPVAVSQEEQAKEAVIVTSE